MRNIPPFQPVGRGRSDAISAALSAQASCNRDHRRSGAETGSQRPRKRWPHCEQKSPIISLLNWSDTELGCGVVTPCLVSVGCRHGSTLPWDNLAFEARTSTEFCGARPHIDQFSAKGANPPSSPAQSSSGRVAITGARRSAGFRFSGATCQTPPTPIAIGLARLGIANPRSRSGLPSFAHCLLASVAFNCVQRPAMVGSIVSHVGRPVEKRNRRSMTDVSAVSLSKI